MVLGYQQLKLLWEISAERGIYQKGNEASWGLEGSQTATGHKTRGGEVEGRDQVFAATAWPCLGTQGPHVLPCPRGPWILSSSTDTRGAGGRSRHFLVSLMTRSRSRIAAYDWSRPATWLLASVLEQGLLWRSKFPWNETSSPTQDCIQVSDVCSHSSSLCDLCKPPSQSEPASCGPVETTGAPPSQAVMMMKPGTALTHRTHVLSACNGQGSVWLRNGAHNRASPSTGE